MKKSSFDISKMQILNSWKIKESENSKYCTFIEIYSYNGGEARIRIRKEEPKADNSTYNTTIKVLNPNLAKQIGEALIEASEEMSNLEN